MFQENVPLLQYSNYKIGGPARYFFEAKTEDEVIHATAEAKRMSLPIFILGGGTNLLISDAGFAGLVIRVHCMQLSKELTTIRVGSGVLVKDFLEFCIENELSGLEWAGGLPGTIGGAVWGNAGAFGGETKDSVREVHSVNISATPEKLVARSTAQCEFSYRDSVFKQEASRGLQEVITEIEFELSVGDRGRIRAGIQEKIDYRKAKQPLDYPNIGSIFKNIPWNRVPEPLQKKFAHKLKTDPFPVLPTAVLIDAAGLKGFKVGGAMVSPKHPNFIINADKASEKDVKKVMEVVRTMLKKEFGVELEQEVILLYNTKHYEHNYKSDWVGADAAIKRIH